MWRPADVSAHAVGASSPVQDGGGIVRRIGPGDRRPALPPADSTRPAVPPRQSSGAGSNVAFVNTPARFRGGPGSGPQLLADEPVFAAAVDELRAGVRPASGSRRKILAEGHRDQRRRVQPAIMAVQLGADGTLARSLRRRKPGHHGCSMGEMRIVAGYCFHPGPGDHDHRAALQVMSKMAGRGGGASSNWTPRPPEALTADSPRSMKITVYSSPRQTVVAGPVDQVDAVIAAVAAQDCRRVKRWTSPRHTRADGSGLRELRPWLTPRWPSRPSVHLDHRHRGLQRTSPGCRLLGQMHQAGPVQGSGGRRALGHSSRSSATRR